MLFFCWLVNKYIVFISIIIISQKVQMCQICFIIENYFSKLFIVKSIMHAKTKYFLINAFDLFFFLNFIFYTNNEEYISQKIR